MPRSLNVSCIIPALSYRYLDKAGVHRERPRLLRNLGVHVSRQGRVVLLTQFAGPFTIRLSRRLIGRTDYYCYCGSYRIIISWYCY